MAPPIEIASVGLKSYQQVVRRGLCSFIIFLASFGAMLEPGGSPSQTPIEKDIRALEPGTLIERELAGGGTHAYQLMLTAGQYLRIAIEQRGIDVVVTVTDPAGKKLTEMDNPNGTQAPMSVSMIAETSGVYRIEVRPRPQRSNFGTLRDQNRRSTRSR
jgi:hypothetical protein